jgi:hypothetical protein
VVSLVVRKHCRGEACRGTAQGEKGNFGGLGQFAEASISEEPGARNPHAGDCPEPVEGICFGIVLIESTGEKVTLKTPFESCSDMDSGSGVTRSVIPPVCIRTRLRSGCTRSSVSWRKAGAGDRSSSTANTTTTSCSA